MLSIEQAYDAVLFLNEHGEPYFVWMEDLESDIFIRGSETDWKKLKVEDIDGQITIDGGDFILEGKEASLLNEAILILTKRREDAKED